MGNKRKREEKKPMKKVKRGKERDPNREEGGGGVLKRKWDADGGKESRSVTSKTNN